MLKAAIALVGLLVVFTACSDDVEMDVTHQATIESAPESEVANNLPRHPILPVTADQLCSDMAVTTVAGKTIQGTRDCAVAKAPCAKVGDVDCTMTKADGYGIHDPQLTPENTRKGLPIGDKVGDAKSTAELCQTDGQVGCIATQQFVAADAATIAAKTILGQTLAGIAGSHDPDYPDVQNVLASATVAGQPGLIPSCTAPGQTSCASSAAYIAVPAAELRPEHIRRQVTIGGVLGTYDGAYGKCTTDGQSSCITTTNLVAMTPGQVDATKVRDQIKLAGITGSLMESPALCDGTVKIGCVTTGDYPAADYARLTPANLKVGTPVAGLQAAILGDFPSANHPLAGHDAGVTDLTGNTFAASMSQASTFEYWDSTGQRHTGTGDSELIGANLVDTVTIFDVAGTVTRRQEPCSTILKVGCVVTAPRVSYDQNLLTAGNIKQSVIVNGNGQVTGAFPSAAHTLDSASAVADLTSAGFNTQVADSGTSFEYWNSLGQRVEDTGSAHLVPANLLSTATIFGVAGNVTIRPVNCDGNTTIDCVTSLNFPAYDPAQLTAGIVKKSVTIGRVTGDYPSANHPLPGEDANVPQLLPGTFDTQLTSITNAAFEYWDVNGQRQSANGSSLLSAIHLKDNVTVFGKTGTLTPRSPDCTAAGAQGCIATASFPSYDPAKLTPAVIKNDHVLLTHRGTYPSAANPLPDDLGPPNLAGQADLYSKLSSAANFEFWNSAGERKVMGGDADLLAQNIADGVDILGVAGAMPIRPEPCTGENQDQCVATAIYKTYVPADLTPGLLKSHEILGGVTGAYPSAAYPLEHATATADLKGGADFNTAVTAAGSVEYFDALGNRYSQNTELLRSQDVLTTKAIFGVNGNMLAAPQPCSATVWENCLTSINFPAYEHGVIAAENIKADFSIGGVTGTYPSHSNRLAGNTATADLNALTFESKIVSNDQFEFWDAKGQRYILQGDGDITADNLLETIEVFGVTGTMKTGSDVVIPMAVVRAGVEVGNQTGTLKIACNNTGSAGSLGEVTIDDENAGQGQLPPRAAFGAENSCNQGSFVDQKFENGRDCINSFACVYKDMVSGKLWHSTKSNSIHLSWQNAKNFCTGIGDGWRLPTHKEYVNAYARGLRQLTLANSALYPDKQWLWTATKSSQNTSAVVMVQIHQLKRALSDPLITAGRRAFCIK